MNSHPGPFGRDERALVGVTWVTNAAGGFSGPVVSVRPSLGDSVGRRPGPTEVNGNPSVVSPDLRCKPDGSKRFGHAMEAGGFCGR